MSSSPYSLASVPATRGDIKTLYALHAALVGNEISLKTLKDNKKSRPDYILISSTISLKNHDQFVTMSQIHPEFHKLDENFHNPSQANH